MIQLELERKLLNTAPSNDRRFWWKQCRVAIVSDSVFDFVYHGRDTIMRLPEFFEYWPSPPRTLLYNKNDTIETN